jgi:8-oxo-dGTP pyrophosphatase MutT (NUDIX family)
MRVLIFASCSISQAHAIQDESSCALVIRSQLVHLRPMDSAKLELIRSERATAGPFRKIAERRQVAAVCFRILSTGIEFLLVRTRRNRWTFPKGGIQPGLTHAQSAAIEAYEEAGVHGRIEEAAFTRYTLRKQKKTGHPENSVQAHLCDVLRLGDPEEFNRNPTWFSSVKAKQRLAEGRTKENAAELARVIDQALARIRRFPARTLAGNDPLMKVKFEAAEFYAQNPTAKAKLPPPSHSSVPPRRGKLLELRVIQPDRT